MGAGEDEGVFGTGGGNIQHTTPAPNLSDAGNSYHPQLQIWLP